MENQLFLTISVPKHPRYEGIAKNKVYRVTVGDRAISLKAFCKGLDISYQSILKKVELMGFGEIHAPFIEVVNAMRKRRLARDLAKKRCAHCNGLGWTR